MRPARPLLAAAVVTALLLVCAPVPALAGTLTVPQYATAVDRALSDVRLARASIDTSGAVAALVGGVRKELPSDAEVADGSRTYPLDPGLEPLLSALERADTSASRARALGALEDHLVSLEDAIGQPGPAYPSDPAALRELLGQRGPAQSANGTDWLSQRVNDILRRIADWLSSVTGGAASTSDTRALSYVLLTIPALLLVVLLVRALRAWRRSAARGAGAARAIGGREPVVEAAADLPADPLEYAIALAREGRRRDALRALFGGAARRLADTGVLQRMRTRTNAELLRDVRRAMPRALSSLTDLSDRFERAWYGHVDPGDAGFEAAREAYLAVLDAASRRDEGEAR